MCDFYMLLDFLKLSISWQRLMIVKLLSHLLCAAVIFVRSTCGCFFRSEKLLLFINSKILRLNLEDLNDLVNDIDMRLTYLMDEKTILKLNTLLYFQPFWKRLRTAIKSQWIRLHLWNKIGIQYFLLRWVDATVNVNMFLASLADQMPFWNGELSWKF